MNRLISVFPNTDLRSGHAGLTKVALKAKRDVSKLEPGNFILFINRNQSAFKMFASNNMVVHYKSPRGRIHIDAIQYLPACFNGEKLNYNKALGMALEKTLGKRHN